nr:hypothetical protein [Streptomyces sp. SID4917]
MLAVALARLLAAQYAVLAAVAVRSCENRVRFGRVARSSRRTPGCLPTPLAGPEDFDYLEGWTLHRLRRGALTHDAEDGTSTPMLLARARHASVRSLERYARSGVDAVAQHVDERAGSRRP